MSLSLYAEFVLVALISILVLDVNSQDNFTNGFDDRRSRPTIPDPSACNPKSYCTRLGQCRPLRAQKNWRTVGVTCGYGQGAFRRVCCPGSPTSRTPVDSPITPYATVNMMGCGTIAPSSFGTRSLLIDQYIPEGAWPWMAAITMVEVGDTYTPWCTGFLIDQKHVLSAAHCFDRRDVNLYQVRIGRVNQTEGDMYLISRIAVPPRYRQGLYYDDIALLTLDRNVTTADYNAICLPDEKLNQRNLTGYGTFLAAWGPTSPNGKLSMVLQQVYRMPIVGNQECNRIFRQRVATYHRMFPRGVNSGFICAGFPEGETDPCGGDSGGPLMLQDRNKFYAIGIASFGYSCGHPGIPGGYTKVSQYLDWIAENIRN